MVDHSAVVDHSAFNAPLSVPLALRLPCRAISIRTFGPLFDSPVPARTIAVPGDTWTDPVSNQTLARTCV